MGMTRGKIQIGREKKGGRARSAVIEQEIEEAATTVKNELKGP